MSWEFLIIAVAGIAIAWANGSNDVSKGIATLVGAGVTNYSRALRWGTLFTALGAITGAFLAHALIATFGGKLLDASVVPTLAVALATIMGAAGWVLFATRAGLPVSTTHAIVGSLVGVAVIAFGANGVAWDLLIWKVALPLLLSPVVAFVLTIILRLVWERFRGSRAGGVDCICVAQSLPAAVGPGHAFTMVDGQPRLVVSTCEIHGNEGTAANILISIDQLHWFTAGLTSFARGMNDAPKLAGLMLGAAALFGSNILSIQSAFVIIALAMTGGALLAGRRVTRVLAEDVTVMGHREGFMANMVTSILVSSGAVLGLPMSTTHVSASAIMGVGAAGKQGDLRKDTVRKLLAGWVITLPGAAVIGIVMLRLISALFPTLGGGIL